MMMNCQKEKNSDVYDLSKLQYIIYNFLSENKSHVGKFW